MGSVARGGGAWGFGLGWVCWVQGGLGLGYDACNRRFIARGRRQPTHAAGDASPKSSQMRPRASIDRSPCIRRVLAVCGGWACSKWVDSRRWADPVELAPSNPNRPYTRTTSACCCCAGFTGGEPGAGAMQQPPQQEQHGPGPAPTSSQGQGQPPGTFGSDVCVWAGGKSGMD